MRNNVGFGNSVLWVVGDEIRSEEVKGKTKPKEPFVICEEATSFVLLNSSGVVFVHEFHFHIEFFALQGTLKFQHLIIKNLTREGFE